MKDLYLKRLNKVVRRVVESLPKGEVRSKDLEEVGKLTDLFQAYLTKKEGAKK